MKAQRKTSNASFFTAWFLNMKYLTSLLVYKRPPAAKCKFCIVKVIEIDHKILLCYLCRKKRLA